jgi:hypothetical protein
VAFGEYSGVPFCSPWKWRPGDTGRMMTSSKQSGFWIWILGRPMNGGREFNSVEEFTKYEGEYKLRDRPQAGEVSR